MPAGLADDAEGRIAFAAENWELGEHAGRRIIRDEPCFWSRPLKCHNA